MAFKYLAKVTWDNKFKLLAIAVATFLIGEFWFRAPFILQRLEYHPDPQLGAKLKPGQQGFSWLGEMSLKSPPISVNIDGYRGKEVDWSEPTILALGASDTFGSSVSDDDVWSNRLEVGLRQYAELADVQVINAGHPGHGPSHHLLRIKRFLERKTPELIIVRVGVGMRMFEAPQTEEERAEAYKKAQSRENIRKVTKFFPFLYNKSRIQIKHIKQGVRPFFLRKKQTERREAKKSVADNFWENNKDDWLEIMRLAEARSIPLIFVVNDLTGLKSNRLISNYLEKASQEFSDIYSLYLGPETIGLENIEYRFAKRLFRENYSLRLDLHGNALQHQILADNHVAFIKSKGILGELTGSANKAIFLSASRGRL